jgi:hypothetical protein
MLRTDVASSAATVETPDQKSDHLEEDLVISVRVEPFWIKLQVAKDGSLKAPETIIMKIHHTDPEDHR